MARYGRVLGQQAPTAGVLTTLYTVPALREGAVTALMVCNRGKAATKFRLSVAIAGASDTAAQYVYYDVPIAANDTFGAELGMTLAGTDVVRCYTASSDVAFNLFGREIP